MDEESSGNSSPIEVFLRIRPSSNKHNDDYFYIDDIDESKITFRAKSTINDSNLNVNNSKTKHSFKFNGILNSETKQDEVFHHIGAPAVNNVLQGLNSTVFAYGQTGSGKVSSIYHCFYPPHS